MAIPNVVVFIPGILGSELWHGEELIWPGTVWEYVRGYRRMVQLLDPETKAGDIIRRFGPLAQYGTLLRDLGTCGFSETTSPPTLYVFPYDWRKDNALAVALLADRVDAIAAEHAGAAQISLVAHSMGGIVARSYLESGKYSQRPGFGALCQLVTLATPHRGAPLALAAALGEVSRLFLSRSQVQTLANNSDYPSLYQLLPTMGEPFVWNEDIAANFAALDVYDADVASRLPLSAPNLESARVFQQGLSLTRRPTHVRYFSFVGTEFKTTTAIGLLPWRSGYRVRRLDAPHAGDATVPLWSAAVNGVQGYPVGGEHGTIFRDDMLRRILAGILGKQGLLAAELPKIVVVVPERVVAPEEPLDVHLTMPTPVGNLHGAIHFMRIPLNDTGTEGVPVVFGAPHEVRYSGSAVSRIHLIVNAPSVAGFYEAAFVPDGTTGPQASDRFIVQA